MNRREFIRRVGIGSVGLFAGKSLISSAMDFGNDPFGKTTASAKPWGGGPFSGLDWYSGSYSHNADLERLRVGSSGKPGRIDMVQIFPSNGGWDILKKSPKIWMKGDPNHKWLVSNRTPAINVAFRVWPSTIKSDKSRRFLDRVPSSWPASDKISDDAWISPRVPIGWKPGMHEEEGRALSMEVWEKAAEGYFNKKWEEVLMVWKREYFDALNRSDLKIVWRPFWECNTSADPGKPHPIGSSTYGCAESDSEIKIVLAGQSEMFKTMKKIFPGSLVHWCPLKKGRTKRDVRLYCPADVDIIGPDYYDTWPPSHTDAEWEKNSMASGNDGSPIGIKRWIEFARSRKKMFGIGEWGIGIAEAGASKKSAGGDNPLFIRKMLETFHANRDILCYEVYFNSSEHYIGGNKNPRASESYKNTFTKLT